MSNPIRIVVIGAGKLGTFHGQKIRALEDELNLEFVGIVDPSETQRIAACRKLQCRGFEELYDGLLDNIDAAVVAAPTPLHRDLGVTLLSKGIHTLMEKPLAISSEQTNSLLAASRKSGAILQVGHVERFNPAFTEARKHINQPRYIHSKRASGFTFRSVDVSVTLDLLIHDIDLVLTLVNSPVAKVDAIGQTLVSGHEDVVQARITFENDCIADLEASRVSRTPTRKMEIWSEDCFTEIDFANRVMSCVHPEEQVLCGQFDVNRLDQDDLNYFKENLMDEMLPQMSRSFASVDALELEMRDFVRSIVSGRAPIVTGQAGAEAVVVAEKIINSIKRNERVLHRFAPMPEIFKIEDYRKAV